MPLEVPDGIEVLTFNAAPVTGSSREILAASDERAGARAATAHLLERAEQVEHISISPLSSRLRCRRCGGISGLLPGRECANSSHASRVLPRRIPARSRWALSRRSSCRADPAPRHSRATHRYPSHQYDKRGGRTACYRDIIDEAPAIHQSQNQSIMDTVLSGHLLRAYRGQVSPAQALADAAHDFRGQARG